MKWKHIEVVKNSDVARGFGKWWRAEVLGRRSTDWLLFSVLKLFYQVLQWWILDWVCLLNAVEINEWMYCVKNIKKSFRRSEPSRMEGKMFSNHVTISQVQIPQWKRWRRRCWLKLFQSYMESGKPRAKWTKGNCCSLGDKAIPWASDALTYTITSTYPNCTAK